MIAEDAAHALRSTWTAEQQRLSQLAVLDDAKCGFRLPWADTSVPPQDDGTHTEASSPPAGALPALERIGGLDISFVQPGSGAVASLVVLSFPGLEVVYRANLECVLSIPYIPGFLAFREVGPLQQLLADLKQRAPELFPQILFLDGNGVLHPRRCGLATHLGVLTDIPTVGAAKTLFAVDGLPSERAMKALVGAADAAAGGRRPYPLIGKSGALWGNALVTGNGSNPIFISAGHRISQASAVRLVQLITPKRVAEPIRQADLGSRLYIRQHPELAAMAAAAAGAAGAGDASGARASCSPNAEDQES